MTAPDMTARQRLPLSVLGLDEDELVACVACGLCLPHCPTYRVTGLEAASPRGRIAAMREVELKGAPIDATFLRVIDECVQCRGCEAACPSAVPFGRLMEGTRAALAATAAYTSGRPWYRRAGEWFAYRVALAHHRVLLALTWLTWFAQRLRVLPARLGIPVLRAGELARPLDIPVGGSPDAWVFTGCVMDAWMRDTHRATAKVLGATGLSCAR
jgi:glycolate oxidase iron-sulfur subunit